MAKKHPTGLELYARAFSNSEPLIDHLLFQVSGKAAKVDPKDDWKSITPAQLADAQQWCLGCNLPEDSLSPSGIRFREWRKLKTTEGRPYVDELDQWITSESAAGEVIERKWIRDGAEIQKLLDQPDVLRNVTSHLTKLIVEQRKDIRTVREILLISFLLNPSKFEQRALYIMGANPNLHPKNEHEQKLAIRRSLPLSVQNGYTKYTIKKPAVLNSAGQKLFNYDPQNPDVPSIKEDGTFVGIPPTKDQLVVTAHTPVAVQSTNQSDHRAELWGMIYEDSLPPTVALERYIREHAKDFDAAYDEKTVGALLDINSLIGHYAFSDSDFNGTGFVVNQSVKRLAREMNDAVHTREVIRLYSALGLQAIMRLSMPFDDGGSTNISVMPGGLVRRGNDDVVHLAWKTDHEWLIAFSKDEVAAWYSFVYAAKRKQLDTMYGTNNATPRAEFRLATVIRSIVLETENPSISIGKGVSMSRLMRMLNDDSKISDDEIIKESNRLIVAFDPEAQRDRYAQRTRTGQSKKAVTTPAAAAAAPAPTVTPIISKPDATATPTAAAAAGQGTVIGTTKPNDVKTGGDSSISAFYKTNPIQLISDEKRNFKRPMHKKEVIKQFGSEVVYSNTLKNVVVEIKKGASNKNTALGKQIGQIMDDSVLNTLHTDYTDEVSKVRANFVKREKRDEYREKIHAFYALFLRLMQVEPTDADKMEMATKIAAINQMLVKDVAPSAAKPDQKSAGAAAVPAASPAKSNAAADAKSKAAAPAASPAKPDNKSNAAADAKSKAAKDAAAAASAANAKTDTSVADFLAKDAMRRITTGLKDGVPVYDRKTEGNDVPAASKLLDRVVAEIKNGAKDTTKELGTRIDGAMRANVRLKLKDNYAVAAEAAEFKGSGAISNYKKAIAAFYAAFIYAFREANDASRTDVESAIDAVNRFVTPAATSTPPPAKPVNQKSYAAATTAAAAATPKKKAAAATAAPELSRSVRGVRYKGSYKS